MGQTTDRKFKIVNKNNWNYLCEGLTYNDGDIAVLDDVLNAFDEKSGVVTRIANNDKAQGYESTLSFTGPQILVVLDKYLTPEGKILCTATIMNHLKAIDLPPLLMLNLQSPSMDIPQRIEIPLRYIIKGGPALDGTHMVYLHALEIDEQETFVYYGITKRGWMKRFLEHAKLAMKGTSKRKFPSLMGKGMRVRMDEIFMKIKPGKGKLTGSYHVVCAAGRTAKNAEQIEKYLIDKHSLQKDTGLNMISGKGKR